MKETIQLLDGTTHTKQELIDNAYSDDFYYNYLGKAALSSSTCKLLLDSPKTYHYVTKYGQKSSQALRAGWLFHTMILEPEKIEECVFVNVQSKNTKAYKEAKQYHDQVFTIKEKQDAERLVDAFHRNDHTAQYMTGAKYEIPQVGMVGGMPFRGKADVLLNNGGLVDLKTTTNVKDFQVSAQKFKYHMQCYIYCELFNVPYDKFTFIAIDKANLDVGIFKCSKEFYEKGKDETLQAIELYKEFFLKPKSIDSYIYEGTL